MICSNRSVYILIIVCLICTLQTSTAQKKKKRKKQHPISKDELQKAEGFFIEGQKYFLLEDYTKALVEFEKCQKINPKNATVYFKIAESQTKSEAFETALVNILKAIELEDNNKYYYLLAANIYNIQARYADTAIIYETMLEKIQDLDSYYFELATIYLYQKRYRDALSAYDRAEKALGVTEDISHQKQKIYLQLNQLKNAIREGEKLVSTYPETSQHTISLVNILTANDKEAKAIDLLTNLLEKDPNNGEALLMLASLQKNTGDISAYQDTMDKIHENPDIDIDIKVQLIAKNIYQIASARSANHPNQTLENNTLNHTKTLVERHPNNVQFLTLYGDLLYALDKKKEALKKYVKSLSLDDSSFQTWHNVLQLEYDFGNSNTLVKHANQALETFPNQAIIYMYLGLAHLQLKNYLEAIHALEHGKKLSIENQPQIAVFSSLLGSAYNGNKDYYKSDNAYQEALNINPEDHQTLNNYSYFLSLRKENLENAEKMAKKVVSIFPSNATYLDTYAWVLYRREKYKEAKVQIEKAIKVGEPSAVFFDHYGDILHRLGEVDNAIVQWKKAKSLDKSIHNIEKKIETMKIHE